MYSELYRANRHDVMYGFGRNPAVAACAQYLLMYKRCGDLVSEFSHDNLDTTPHSALR